MQLTLNAFWEPRLGNHLGDYRPRVQVDPEGGEGTRARGALVPRVGSLVKINALTFADEGHTVIKHVLILDDGGFGLWPLNGAPAGGARGRPCRSWSGGALGAVDGDGEMESRAAADFAFDPDAAAMHLDDVLGDGETAASAACLAGARGVDAIAALGDGRLVGGGDADAGIGDGEDDFGAAHFRADHDSTPRERVLRGIVEQILQDFGEAAAISGDVGQAVEWLDGNGNFFFCGAMARGFDAGFDELRDADAANFELEPVGVHFGEHEQIFGEAAEAARWLDDNFEETLSLFRSLHAARGQKFLANLNGGERRAGFVRNLCDR